MRKIALFTIGTFCLSFVANAQIQKGSLFLGGSVYFNNSDGKLEPVQGGGSVQENKRGTWNLLPQIGVAVGTNKIAGVFLNVGGRHDENSAGNNFNRNKYSNAGGGVFYRQYYPLSQRFYLFGEASLGVSFDRSKTTNSNGTITYTSSDGKGATVGFALTPGISYAAGRKVFLEAALNSLLAFAYITNEGKYYNANGTVSQSAKQNSFSAAANANGFSGISIGLRWILPKKPSAL